MCNQTSIVWYVSYDKLPSHSDEPYINRERVGTDVRDAIEKERYYKERGYRATVWWKAEPNETKTKPT